MEYNETREQLYKKFKEPESRGAAFAFCRHKGISDEWLRQVLTGKHENLDLLIEAADFLKTYRANKAAERSDKQEMLEQKVKALASNG
jgi:hypothetical protein